MSAFPRDPEHFFRWVRSHHDAAAQPQDFVPRRVYGDYVEGLLTQAAEFPGNARLERRHESVVGIDRRGDHFVVRLSSGRSTVARAVVLATGSATRHRLGPGRAARVRAPRRRPLDPGAARRRPPAGRHRPDHGRRGDLGRPRGPHPAHGLAPRPRPRRAPDADDPGRAAAAGRDPHRLARRAAPGDRHPRRAHGRRDRRLARRRRRPAAGDRPALERPQRRRPPRLPGRATPARGTSTATGCRR